MGMNGRLLRPKASGYVASDADARAYLSSVRSADGSALETAVQQAINNFVVGCKADGIWSSIKASCILAGARTLAGALTPLVGAAPTNVNFVTGDYNRKTGLKGNASNKRITVNRANNADPQDNAHWYVRVTKAPSTLIRSPIGSGAFLSNSRGVYVNSSTDHRMFANSGPVQLTNATSLVGGLGASRGSSLSISSYLYGTTVTSSSTSGTPVSNGFAVMAADTSGGASSDCRIAMYSVGENLTVSVLDARVSTLLAAIGAAIP